MGGHLADRRFGEGARRAARSDEHRRLHPGDHSREIEPIGRRQAIETVEAQLGGAEGKLELVVVQLVAIGEDQTLRVDGHDRLLGAGCVQTLRHQCRADEPGDPGARGARAQEDEALLAQRPAGRPDGGKNAGQDHRPGSLDVVVEARDAVAIAVQDPNRVVLLEVLPLQDRPRADLEDCADEGFEEVVVLASA